MMFKGIKYLGQFNKTKTKKTEIKEDIGLALEISDPFSFELR